MDFVHPVLGLVDCNVAWSNRNHRLRSKCAAPTPLVWWKKGPLITINGDESEARIKEIKSVNAKGVVYELSNEETYFVDTAPIEERIKKLVKEYE